MAAQSEAILVARLKNYSRLAGLAAISIGSIVIVGWILNIPALKTMALGVATMKANTALAFILAGMALVMLHRENGPRVKWIAQVSATAVLLLGLLTLLEYILNWNPGIDQWLVRDFQSLTYPGRMSPVSAANFLMVGVSLLLIRSGRNKPAQALALITGFLSILSIVGYLYGVQSLYQISQFNSIALHTAITFLVMSLGLLLARPESGLASIFSSNSAGGILARRLLPAAVILPIALGWLRLQGQLAGLYDTEFGLTIFALSNVVVFSLLIGWIAFMLRSIDSRRIQAEEALGKREEEYRALVENAPDTIATLDRDHRVRFLNRAAFETVESLTGRSVYEFMYPEWHDSYRETLNRVFERGSTEGLEVQAVRPGGQFVWSSLRFAPILENGQVAEVIVISTDITEQKLAEEALHQREEQYRQLFEANPHPMFVADLETLSFLAVNDAAVNHYGYSREEFLTMTAADLRAPEDPDVVLKQVAEFRQQPSSYTKAGVIRHHKKDGSVILVEIAAHRLNYNGRNCAVTAVYDLTERLRAEEALRASEEQYRELFEANPHPMVVADIETGTYLAVNDAAIEKYGYSRDEFVGMSWTKLRYSENISKDAQLFKNLEQEGLSFVPAGVTRHVKKDGTSIFAEVKSHPITYQGRKAVLAAAYDLTERLRAEEAVRRSEELFAAIFQAVPAAIAITMQRDERILNVNRAAVEMMEYEADEIVGRIVSETGIWSPASRRVEFIQELRAKGFVRSKEAQWKTKSGKIVDVLISMEPMKVNGEPCVLVIALDISERKRSGEAVQRSEARLSGILESAMDAIITIDDRQQIVYFNAAAETMFHCKNVEVVGQPISKFIPERFREVHEEHIHMFGRKGVTNRRMGALSAISGLRKNGEEFPLEASISQMEINSGKFYTVILRDITERKLAEEVIRRSEELFSSIFQSVPVAIDISTVREGRVLNANQEFFKLTGYSSVEVLNHTVGELGLWYPASQRVELVQQLQEKGSVSGVESKWKTRSGEIVAVLIYIVPIEIGGEACILAIGLDLTERKQAEKMRLEVYKEREVLEIKERFISTMSHEFRTPLAVIVGAKESLQHYYDRLKPERREEHFKNIDEQVRYLTMMIDEVLTLNKGRSGKLKFNPAPLDLNVFCHKLFEQVQLTDTRTHQFTFVGDEQLKHMDSDPQLLQHILINLLSNAIKYSPEGGEVRFELARTGNEAHLRISDQGIGIPEEDQKHLFEPFYRASNTGKIKGTGLGLAIVKESVEVHSGTITCESAEGKGTTFIVRLPIQFEHSKLHN